MPAVDWSAPPSLAPHVGFANRAMDWIVWPGDNKTYAYVDDGGATVRAPDRDGVARVFRIDACARRWHSIVVDDGSRWSFGFMLPQAKALELLGRAA